VIYKNFVFCVLRFKQGLRCLLFHLAKRSWEAFIACQLLPIIIRVMSEYMAGEVHHSSRIFQKLRPEKHVANH